MIMYTLENSRVRTAYGTVVEGKVSWVAIPPTKKSTTFYAKNYKYPPPCPADLQQEGVKLSKLSGEDSTSLHKALLAAGDPDPVDYYFLIWDSIHGRYWMVALDAAL